MPRTFDGANDNIICSIGASGIVGAETYAAIVRRAANGTYHSIMGGHTSGGLIARNIELNDVNKLEFNTRTGTGATSTVTVQTTDGWCLVAVTRPAGASQTCRSHIYKFAAETWSHANMAATQSNAPSMAGGSFRFGEWEGSDDYNGDIAAGAVWDRVLSDNELEHLISSFAAWERSGPVGLWILDQSPTTNPVKDLSGGGANQTSVAGTTVGANNAPITYGDDPLTWTRIQGAGGGVSEDVAPGGATAGGVGPSAAVLTATGGAQVAGTAPTARVALSTPGGATVGGSAPVARADATTGGATVGGSAPAARADASVGGATGAGTGAAARVDVSAGGATGGGTGPAEPGGDTVPPGGAIAGGTAPTSRADVSPGGLSAQGTGPAARVTLTPGGALGGGTAPSSRTTLSPGGATCQGTGPVARVTLSPGGAIGGGIEPFVASGFIRELCFNQPPTDAELSPLQSTADLSPANSATITAVITAAIVTPTSTDVVITAVLTSATLDDPATDAELSPRATDAGCG